MMTSTASKSSGCLGNMATFPCLCDFADTSAYREVYTRFSVWVEACVPSLVLAIVRNIALEIVSNVRGHATKNGTCAMVIHAHEALNGLDIMVEDDGRGITLEHFSRLQARFTKHGSCQMLTTSISMQPDRHVGTCIRLAFRWHEATSD